MLNRIDWYCYIDVAANTKIWMKSFRRSIFYKQLSIRMDVPRVSPKYVWHLMIYQYLFAFEWMSVKMTIKYGRKKTSICHLNATIFIFNDSIRIQMIKFYDWWHVFTLALLIFTQCLIENVHKRDSIGVSRLWCAVQNQLILGFSRLAEYKYFALL